jgi:hypothetical protein
MRHAHLYLILDVYSRKIVGFEVQETDSSDHAVELLRRTAVFAEPERSLPAVGRRNEQNVRWLLHDIRRCVD